MGTCSSSELAEQLEALVRLRLQSEPRMGSDTHTGIRSDTHTPHTADRSPMHSTVACGTPPYIWTPEVWMLGGTGGGVQLVQFGAMFLCLFVFSGCKGVNPVLTNRHLHGEAPKLPLQAGPRRLGGRLDFVMDAHQPVGSEGQCFSLGQPTPVQHCTSNAPCCLPMRWLRLPSPFLHGTCAEGPFANHVCSRGSPTSSQTFLPSAR